MRFINMTRRNRTRALGALLLTMAVGVIAPTAQANAAYEIKPRHSNKCVDVAGQSTGNGARLIQWTCNGQRNQQFSFVHTDSGYYQIVAAHSGKCLDVKDGSVADYAPVWQWSCHVPPAKHQQFLLRDAGNGYYNLVPRHIGGKCLDIERASTADGAAVIQHGCTGFGGANQQFSLHWR